MIGPVAAAMTVGGLIGVERTYHGHPAGFRTHTLVCLTSCVLMLAAMHQSTWAFAALPGQTVVIDPTRMAHGILTGIGFLCAGVIFREGFSVKGLTTAASLWTTSAIGVLFGVGMTALAVVAAGTTLTVLAVLRLLDARLPHVAVLDVTLTWVDGKAPGERALRELLVRSGIKAMRIEHVVDRQTKVHQHAIKAKGQTPLDIEELCRRLSELDGLTAFSLIPRDE